MCQKQIHLDEKRVCTIWRILFCVWLGLVGGIGLEILESKDRSSMDMLVVSLIKGVVDGIDVASLLVLCEAVDNEAAHHIHGEVTGASAGGAGVVAVVVYIECQVDAFVINTVVVDIIINVLIGAAVLSVTGQLKASGNILVSRKLLSNCRGISPSFHI